MTNKNFFTVNFFDIEEKGIKANTISGSTANFKKASKGSGAAYEELCRLMKEHPEFTLVEIKPKKHIEGKKESHEGMDYDFMRTIIKIRKTEKAETALAEFEKVKAYAEDTKLAVYPFMKKWFINNYGEADTNGVKHFSMAKAKAEISEYHQREAEKYEAKKVAETAPTETEVHPIGA